MIIVIIFIISILGMLHVASVTTLKNNNSYVISGILIIAIC